ncbi:MAG: ADP-ribose diphosphatase [Rhodospirillaceae bacterium]|nr:ADP-ribose diphosphatase [Rhodospirillaceae bacterium]
MNRSDVEIIEREELYNGFFKMRRYSLKHRTFSGEWSSILSREVFERGGVAAVIPFDPIRDEVVLIEQFRPGPMAAGHSNPWTVEIVAGILEEGETPEALAHRETEEETGGTLQDVIYINNFFMAPGSSSELGHLLCGQIDATNIGGIHGNDDEGEDIRVFSEPATAAFKRVQRGEIASAFSIIGLQWLELNREALRRRWT